MNHYLPAIPNDGYLPRIADGLLDEALQISGAVCVRGPKWCGKTATCARRSASQVYMQDPDRSASLLALADSMPSAILAGPEPRLIDEWQMAPQLWDAVRFAVDRGRGRGRFILTGSATPKARPAHSGVGRICTLKMSTMTLFETGESSGAVSLRELFEGNPEVGSLSDMDVMSYAYAVCRGGWPEAVVEPNSRAALKMASLYADEIIERDIEVMDETRRNSTWMRAIMRSYARNVSSEASLTTIANDMQGDRPSDLTVSEYVNALTRACVFEDLLAWNPRLRSKTAVRTSPTRHFSDPSVAAAMLGASPETLMGDFETFGLLFESLCVHDLRVYAEAMGAAAYHYRDKTGLEADLVLSRPDGRWAAIEVKLGSRQVDDAAKHLLKLADRVDQDHEGAPSFLAVVTGTQAAYRREDGVYVLPLGTLAP